MSPSLTSTSKGVAFSDGRTKINKIATDSDPVTSTAYRLTKNGLPTNHRYIPKVTCHYWDIRDKLCTEDDLLVKDAGVVIPTVLCDQFLPDLHKTHCSNQESVASQNNSILARDCCMIDDYAKRCQTCVFTKPMKCLLNHQVLAWPWQKHVWISSHSYPKNHYITADYLSKYMYIIHMRIITAAAVCNQLKQFFARHGMPNS